MKTKHLFLLFLAITACSTVKCQDIDALPIFANDEEQNTAEEPPESENVLTEGSGAGIIDDSVDNSQVTPIPLEAIDSRVNIENEEASTATSAIPCPSVCVCNIENNDFVVDCSGYNLTEFPSPIDPGTTVLKLQNNKLTELPKEIAILKSLTVLNAENNQIMELLPGTISELQELVVLKLGNNRLIEYPQELRNSFTLLKLKELDLGGNDIRTELTPEVFTIFESLTKLTLPTTTTELVNGLCESLKSSLDTVCTGSCLDESYECPDAPQEIGDDLLEVTTERVVPEYQDDVTTTDNSNIEDSVTSDPEYQESATIAEMTSEANIESVSANNNIPGDDLSLRAAIGKEPSDVSLMSSIVEASSDNSNNESESGVKVGATTTDTKTGGIDKSIIGLVIAGMIVIVAAIVIKKNWTSIKKRFSSAPRPANERTAGIANGASPEEVPLQDKNPV